MKTKQRKVRKSKTETDIRVSIWFAEVLKDTSLPLGFRWTKKG